MTALGNSRLKRFGTRFGTAAAGIVVATLAWSGVNRAAVTGAAGSDPVVEQKGHPARMVATSQTDQPQERDNFARLLAERPVGVIERPLTVEVTPAERSALGVNEPGSRKLRVGTVKTVNANVRFDDLSPSDLRGRKTRDHGVLQGTGDGGFVWTTAVRSPGASALQIRIDGFFLPARAELWIYTAAGEAHGPYSWAGPQGSREFWTHSVTGAEAFLQLRMRGPVSQGDLRRLGFVIADVAHVDDASLRGEGPAAADQLTPGFCNYNAPCVVSGECAGPGWDSVRKAVAHIRFVSGAYVYICSGGLVADSSPGDTPYFLTANHCISRSREASSMEAYFQFRSTQCGPTSSNCGNPSASVPRTVGASIVSTNKTSDYTLLRLSQPAPAGSFFLGWSTAPVANANGAQLFRFSHPLGAPQAYSAHLVDTSKTTCGSWPRGAWIYSRDAEGATEGGSSGSPVVNGGGQIVGQLSGACGFNLEDKCDRDANATVDGAFANYYSAVAPYLGPGSSNQSPTATFTFACDGLTCSFDGGESRDPDGTIATFAWTFGDGATGSGAQVEHSYATAGTFTVGLTVTDNGGSAGSTTRSVTVAAAGGVVLSASGYKVKGLQKVDLSWSGASGTVRITRNGNVLTTTTGSSYTDNIDAKGGGSYTYQVCETDTTPVCSAPVTVTF